MYVALDREVLLLNKVMLIVVLSSAGAHVLVPLAPNGAANFG